MRKAIATMFLLTACASGIEPTLQTKNGSIARAEGACAFGAAAGDAIHNAAWLAGRWIGAGFGGDLEEVWSPPAGCQMIGHFRLTRSGVPIFYELLLLEETSDGLRYKVKHFNPDFTGWEPQDSWHEFPPDSVSPSELHFDGLVVRRVDENTSDHILTHRTDDGAEEHVVLRLYRQ
jgi:hypothetical protein